MVKRRRSYTTPRKVKRRFTRVSRRPRRGMRRNMMLNIARTAVLKQTETKFKALATENVQLYHNAGSPSVFVVQPNLLQTPTGTGQTTRVGDEVFGVGLSVKLWLSNKSDRPNVMYRIMIVACPQDQVTSTSPNGLFKSEVGNKMLDSVDTDKYNVVYHKLLQPFSGDYSLEASSTLREHSKLVKIYIPLKSRRIKYQSDGGSIPSYQKNCLSLVVIAYDAFGSIVSDNIASLAYITKFYFKDP